MSAATTRHVEIERKLDAPSGFVLPDLTDLPRVAGVGDPVEHSLDATYFDTTDLRLATAQLALRRRTGGEDAGWHLKRPAGNGVRTEERYPLGRATKTVPGPLRAGVEVHARGREIVPVVRLRTRRAVRNLLDDSGAVLAEIAVDSVHAAVPSTNGRWTTFTSWDEIEVELVHGKRKLLDKVVDRFVAAGATPSAAPSKFVRALAVAGRVDNPDAVPPGVEPAVVADAVPGEAAAPEGTPGTQVGTEAGARAAAQPGVPTPDLGGPAAPLEAGSAAAVVLAYLASQISHLEDHDPLVRVDAEDAVHQMRVACRRLRSALAVYRPILDRDRTEPLRDELRWLGEELGAARDAEVVRDHLRDLVAAEPEGTVVGPVVERITRTMDERYRAAHDKALVTLDTSRYFTLLDALDDLVTRPPFTPDAERPADEVLLPLVHTTWKRTRKLVDAAREAQDAHERDLQLHEVRKAAKRARYAGESLATTFGKGASKFAKRMEAVQAVLGEHQDSVVIRGYVVELAEAARAAGESTFTYGRLHALEQFRGERTARDFDAVWEEASDPALRRWMR